MNPLIYLVSLGLLVLQFTFESPCIEVGMFLRSYSFSSTLHVFSIVLVCGCNLTLCRREVVFFLLFH